MRETVAQFVAGEDQLTETALVEDSLPLVVHDVGLVVEDNFLGLVLGVFEVG